MEHEWDDFLGVRVRVRQRPRRSRFDVYQPSGWGSPGVKKAARIYWRVTFTIIKMLISIPLAIAAIGSLWFLWVLAKL